ncbi:protein brown-like [Venturia canescens]|uniref:protein brown-like n=1 Tax=Venturia canescens TaxID=32260 RepID=UPI001C9C6EC8|nr:protein brown-like [Venturia canescens]
MMDRSGATTAVDDCFFHKIYSHECQLDEPKFCLSWQNVTVRTNRKSPSLANKLLKMLTGREASMEERAIDVLRSVSGYAESGQMIAVIGPSGAGKTTLLETLAKKIEPISGSIRVNGAEISSQEMSEISSHVPQFDPLPECLTVVEYIAFSCALRLEGRVNREDQKLLARDITLNLSLYECKDSLIRALSGGEKKRLSLAAEIVTKPQILYLDEPTTGLDTSAALRVVESIKSISTRSIVICSIHQPSMTIYKQFSHVIFLAEGRVAFAGTLRDARAFFEGEGARCPFGFDEAQYYVKMLSKPASEHKLIGEATTSREDDDPSARICRAYADSDLSRIPALRLRPSHRKTAFSEKKPRWVAQFNWLVWRIYHENRRTLAEGLISFNYFTISIVLVIIFFWGIDARKERGIQDVMGVLYMASAETIFSTAYTPLYEIEREIPLFRREAGLYCPSAYYVATFVSWLPKTIAKSFLLAIMLYAILSTQDSFFPTFLLFFACSIASGICGLAYGSMVASFVEDNEIATIVMVPIDLIAFLMSGIFYNLRTLKWYTQLLKYISMFYYTNEALAIAHWSQIEDIECANSSSVQCVSTGSEVLLQYGFEESHFWMDILAMIILAVAMNLSGYLGMRRRRSSKLTF